MSDLSIARAASEPCAVTAPARFIFCPNCGGERHTSARIDESDARDAARDAAMLLSVGDAEGAADLLTRLAAVRIVNRLRPAFACCDCGSVFDE